MKPVGLFVLPFYQIDRSFSSNFTVSKPIQNRHKRYSFSIVKRYSAILFRKLNRRADSAFRLLDVGRAALSVKGARQFREDRKRKTQTKFPRVPCGQTFDRLRLALPFSGAPKGRKYVPKPYLFRWDFVPVRWETGGKHYAFRACSSLP